MGHHQIVLTPSAVGRTLAGVIVFLALASVAGQLSKYLLGHDYVYGLVRLFYLDEEQNIPSIFATFQLFFAALLLAIITGIKKKQGDRDVSRWAVLALGFVFLGIDEGASIHELLERPMRALLRGGPAGDFYLVWVIPAVAAMLALVPFFLGFLLRLPFGTRIAFVVAGIIFVGGAVGVELIGGYYAKLHGSQNLTFSMFVTVEETMEKGGIAFFIYSLLKYLADEKQEVLIRFGD